MSGDVVRPHFSSFRRRFAARQTVVGSFIKTPTSHAIEILGDVGFDFAVIDEEHAAFDRRSIDITLLAARASGIAGIVRVAEARASSILSALDCGAVGVLVPHVLSVEKAKEVILPGADTVAGAAAIPARRELVDMVPRQYGPMSTSSMRERPSSR